MGNYLNDAVMLTEMWNARDAERNARQAWATANELRAYVQELEVRIKNLNEVAKELKESNAGNLAEKTALRQFLAHATNGMSPMIADMRADNPKHVKEHAKFLRDQLSKDAKKAITITDNWDSVRQVGLEYADAIRKKQAG